METRTHKMITVLHLSVALQPWRGQHFTQSPRLEGLLEDLNGVSGPGEASDSDSAFDELSIPPSNDMESSCAAPNDWEDRLARQTLDIFRLW